MTFGNTCPSAIEFAMAISGEASDAVRQHITRCPECAAKAKTQRDVVSLAKQMPHPDVSDTRVANVQSNLLNDMATQAAHHKRSVPIRPILAAVAALILTAGVFLLFQNRTTQPGEAHRQVARPSVAARGTVYSERNALYRHLSRQPDEIVRLIDGTITVKVAKLGKGEWFRVVTGDATVEVKGTVFDVTAKDDHLVSVRMISGTVVVRPTDGAPALITGDQIWTPPALAHENGADAGFSDGKALPQKSGEKNASEKQKITSPSTRVRMVQKSPVKANPEALFNAGWTKFRNKQYEAAAADFETVVQSSPGFALREDAAYWRAIAYVRAGDKQRARKPMKQYLSWYPDGQRAEAVGVQLGWIELELGNDLEAEQCFKRGSNASQPRLRQRALDGLKALAGRRPQQ